MKKIAVLILIFSVILGISFVVDKRQTVKTEFVLNTVSSITIKGSNKKAVNSAFERVREIEARMSSHLLESDISTGVLNDDTRYVIEKGIYYGNISDGAFDITIKPVCDLWDINGENPKVPQRAEIERALSLVDYTKINIADNRLILPQGMGVELGAIAKGYSADEALRILKEHNIEAAVVDLGGNIAVVGTKKIGIKNPTSQNNGDYFGTLKITDKAVSTSGGYERFFQQNGKIYHHIFDPSTGYPAETDILSATVICERAIDADCWSTILFSAGLEGAKKYIDQYNLEGVIMDKDENIYVFGNVEFTPQSGFNVIKL